MYYSETSDQREKEKQTERKKMAKQVRFNDKVSQAVFENSKGSKRYIDIVESCPLAEEDEVAARTSEFQLLQREQKKSLTSYARRYSRNILEYVRRGSLKKTE